ncbi:MAG: S-layer homology domain-containing protein [Candidatus Peribacteraceae bacterium]
MKRLLFVSLLIVPALTLALDYTDRSVSYTDAPFSRAESVAISMLTNLGVVHGNPDGSFAAKRTLNRAEFLALALRANPDAADLVSTDCFPDVTSEMWFSGYVCGAKEAEIVKGYPDGLFHPENAVNYVEALKILDGVYGYVVAAPVTREAWYEPFVRAASASGTTLPVSISLDSPLTRGQMARLLAGFVAESEGELALYRAKELGRELSSSSLAASSSSTPSSSSSSAPSSSASSVPASSSSSASSLPDLPARNHLLMLGERTKPVASGTFTATLEPTLLSNASVTFDADVTDRVDSVYLVDKDGVQVGRLSIDVFDSLKRRWKGSFTGSGMYRFPKDVERVLAVELQIKKRDEGGQSEKQIHIESFQISVIGEWSSTTYDTAPQSFSFPWHQTVQARITSVSNAMDKEGLLPIGINRQLAAFTFIGSSISGSDPYIENLDFQLSKSAGVSVTNWGIRNRDGTIQKACSISDNVLSCLNLDHDLTAFSTNFSPTIFLYGDVTLDQGAQNNYLEIDLNNPGALGENGDIRWTDGTGHFTWVELEAPIAKGTPWKA